MELEDWPDCQIEGCQNKCCLALNSQFCFPHTEGNTHVKHMKIDAQHVQTVRDGEPLPEPPTAHNPTVMP